MFVVFNMKLVMYYYVEYKWLTKLIMFMID